MVEPIVAPVNPRVVKFPKELVWRISVVPSEEMATEIVPLVKIVVPL